MNNIVEVYREDVESKRERMRHNSRVSVYTRVVGILTISALEDMKNPFHNANINGKNL